MVRFAFAVFVSIVALDQAIAVDLLPIRDPANASETEAPAVAAPVVAATPAPNNGGIVCPRYKVFYIDPSAQFFTPPVPIEDHAEFVFCSDHPNLDELRLKLRKAKHIRSQPDLDAARIKVYPRGRPDEAITFCSTGELTYHGKQFRLERRAFEPSLQSLRDEGDRQRALAEEAEDDAREPASAERPKPKR